MSTSRMEYDNVPEQQAAYDEGKRAGRAGKGLYYSGPHTPHFLNGVKAGRAERGAEVSRNKQATAYQPLNGCMCQDGTCEACNRVVEAFEAMREACLAAIRYDYLVMGRAAEGRHKDGIAEGKDLDSAYAEWAAKARTALALADKMSRSTPVCDAQDHSTEAEYQACRICHPIDEAAKGKP